MSTTPQPLFDMSKAVPIQSAPTQAAPSPSQGAAPLFDMSKAQPIQQQGISIPSNATISAQPESTGWRDNLSKWAENVSNDIKYGGRTKLALEACSRKWERTAFTTATRKRWATSWRAYRSAWHAQRRAPEK